MNRYNKGRKLYRACIHTDGHSLTQIIEALRKVLLNCRMALPMLLLSEAIKNKRCSAAMGPDAESTIQMQHKGPTRGTAYREVPFTYACSQGLEPGRSQFFLLALHPHALLLSLRHSP